MKNIYEVGKLVSMVSIILIINSLQGTSLKAQVDNTSVKTIRGKVIDKNNLKPLSFASVIIANSEIGTVTNNDGEFILKIPEPSDSKTITISYMGYTPVNYNFTDLKDKNNLIAMTPEVIEFQEIIVRTNDPLELIDAALKHIPDNYGTSPSICTSFYRESVMQNRNYVGVAEAVLSIYKSGYSSNEYDIDRIKVYKGRKNLDVKRMDTVIFKLRGGDNSALLMDLAKNPTDFLDRSNLNQYDFQPVSIINIDGRQSYMIPFIPNKNSKDALYKGYLYIDAATLAIKKVEFEVSPERIERS